MIASLRYRGSVPLRRSHVSLLVCFSVALALVSPACSATPTATTTSDASPPTPSDPRDGSLDASSEGSPDAARLPDASRSDLDKLEDLLRALPQESDDAARARLVEAFLHDVAYGERGFPIRARGKLAVVWWDPERRPDSLALAGDLNGWSTTAAPFAQPVSGVPLHVRLQDDPTPSARSLYKIVRGGTTFLADPLARRYGYDENGEHSMLEAGSDRGHLERWPAFGDSRGSLEARTLAVWVPPSYDPKASPGYPVLLMQDAQNIFGPSGPSGSFRADSSAETAVLANAVRPFVIVGIPNTKQRFDEYTHVKDTLPGYGTVGGSADAYAAFVTSGILPFARSRYALRAEPGQTAILGSSLGGLVSLYVGLRHRSLFGYAGAMSGTMSWGAIGANNKTIRELYVAAPPRGLSIYLDSGGDDGGGCATLSALDSENFHDQYCETIQMRDTLVGLGWVSGTDLVHTWSPMAPHNEAAWAARLPGLFRDWFPKR